MFHWSRLGGSSGERGGRPVQRARGVCVLPLLIPISRETGARRARDWSEGSWTGVSKNLTVAFIQLTKYDSAFNKILLMYVVKNDLHHENVLRNFMSVPSMPNSTSRIYCRQWCKISTSNILSVV